MLTRTFVFQDSQKEQVNTDSRVIEVSEQQHYQEQVGYGFVTEVDRSQSEALQIPELNVGFERAKDCKEETKILADENGCYVEQGDVFPLCFKADVSRAGNYDVAVTFYGSGQVTIYAGFRKLVHKAYYANKGEHTCQFTLNVCDVIPKGKDCLYEHRCIDIAVLGKDVRLQKFFYQNCKIPTVYLAGDTIVADYPAEYPFDTVKSIAGWGQIFPLFLAKNVSLSNQAQSGMNVDTFRTEGYYANIQAHMRLGDYLILHFSGIHGDVQKEMLGVGEYRVCLAGMIEEARAMGAYPILVTPLLDEKDDKLLVMQEKYTIVCMDLGEVYRVPVLNLMDYSLVRQYEDGLQEDEAYQLVVHIIETYRTLADKTKIAAYNRLAGYMMEPQDITARKADRNKKKRA